MRSPGQFHDRFTSSFCRPLPLLVVPSDHETPSAVRGYLTRIGTATANRLRRKAVSSGSLEFETMKGPPRAQASVSARGLTRVFEKALWLYSTSLFLCLFSLLFFFLLLFSFHLSLSLLSLFGYVVSVYRRVRPSAASFFSSLSTLPGVWLCGVPRSSQTGFFVRTHCSATRPDGAKERTRRRERERERQKGAAPLRASRL